ncbi:hypothetical protein VNO77_27068 [Canavalia gladiata]|uniref:Uncharacterized protein n=1 Tax=Canavalia gladiata TaxID=3824 RepID=A0AAN9KV35_CANGL
MHGVGLFYVHFGQYFPMVLATQILLMAGCVSHVGFASFEWLCEGRPSSPFVFTHSVLLHGGARMPFSSGFRFVASEAVATELCTQSPPSPVNIWVVFCGSCHLELWPGVNVYWCHAYVPVISGDSYMLNCLYFALVTRIYFSRKQREEMLKGSQGAPRIKVEVEKGEKDDALPQLKVLTRAGLSVSSCRVAFSQDLHHWIRLGFPNKWRRDSANSVPRPAVIVRASLVLMCPSSFLTSSSSAVGEFGMRDSLAKGGYDFCVANSDKRG